MNVRTPPYSLWWTAPNDIEEDMLWKHFRRGFLVQKNFFRFISIINFFFMEK